MSDVIIRPICQNDFSRLIIILNQLTTVTENPILFKQYLDTLHDRHQQFVIEYDNIVVGTATLLLESKIIHNYSSVCHIEDVVIDNLFRGKGLGKKLIKHLIHVAYSMNAYKIILNCSEDVSQFYESCGFDKTNIQMSKYYE